MAGKVLISYRRNDSKAQAGRIYDHLAKYYGRRKIFMDVDTIEPGSDFFEVLERAVSDCQVLVAVIGPSWLNAKDEEGNRRLDDPDDLVRAEIAAALKRNIRVVPVLIDGATMPRAVELPGDVAAITRRHAIAITHERFGSDMEALVQTIKRSGKTNTSLVSTLALGAAAVLSGAAFVSMLQSGPLLDALQRFKAVGQPNGIVTEPAQVIGEEKRSIQENTTLVAPISAFGAQAKGLARIPLHHETMVLYATAPGGASSDGETNSPFAAAISDALKSRVTDAEMIAKKVVADVRVTTQAQQSPVFESNLTRSINLADKGVEKIALIIGNAAYANFDPLPNPAHDVEILTRELGHLDFETIVTLDAGREQLSRTIHRFVRRMQSAPKNTIAVVYYGGHGVQIDGENYMVPTDLKAENSEEVRRGAISLQKILDAMRSADIMASIIMLDACRDDPFKRVSETR